MRPHRNAVDVLTHWFESLEPTTRTRYQLRLINLVHTGHQRVRAGDTGPGSPVRGNSSKPRRGVKIRELREWWNSDVSFNVILPGCPVGLTVNNAFGWLLTAASLLPPLEDGRHLVRIRSAHGSEWCVRVRS